MTHLHILVPSITRGTLARTHELKSGVTMLVSLEDDEKGETLASNDHFTQWAWEEFQGHRRFNQEEQVIIKTIKNFWITKAAIVTSQIRQLL